LALVATDVETSSRLGWLGAAGEEFSTSRTIHAGPTSLLIVMFRLGELVVVALPKR